MRKIKRLILSAMLIKYGIAPFNDVLAAMYAVYYLEDDSTSSDGRKIRNWAEAVNCSRIRVAQLFRLSNEKLF